MKAYISFHEADRIVKRIMHLSANEVRKEVQEEPLPLGHAVDLTYRPRKKRWEVSYRADMRQTVSKIIGCTPSNLIQRERRAA